MMVIQLCIDWLLAHPLCCSPTVIPQGGDGVATLHRGGLGLEVHGFPGSHSAGLCPAGLPCRAIRK